MASRDLTTTYSTLLCRMTIRSLRTFAPSYSNSESDIPTNASDLDCRSKEIPHAEGKKNTAFNRFLKEGPVFPCKVMKDDKYERLVTLGIRKQGLKLRVEDNSLHAKAVEEVDDDSLSAGQYARNYYVHINPHRSRYKMGGMVTELKNTVFNIKTQMMMGNSFDRRRWFTSCTDSGSDATDESNGFSADAFGDKIGTDISGILYPTGPLYVKEEEFANIDNIDGFVGFRHLFFEHGHNIMLENYGLYKKGNTDWLVAVGFKFRYISIENFMWWISRTPIMYEEEIYNYMFKQQIYVLESCPETLLKHQVINCSWRPPLNGWYKLNVSGVFKENLGGTKEACCGGVIRDAWGTVLTLFHKPLHHATSREEVFLLGVYHGIDEILRRRSESENIVLEIDHKKISKVLSLDVHVPLIKKKSLDVNVPMDKNMPLYFKIIGMLSNFDRNEIFFQFPQGNSLAKRVAYIASHLTMGQSFPIGERGYETQVRCDQLNIPRYEIVPKKRIEDEELSDDEESSDDDDMSNNDFEDSDDDL